MSLGGFESLWRCCHTSVVKYDGWYRRNINVNFLNFKTFSIRSTHSIYQRAVSESYMYIIILFSHQRALVFLESSSGSGEMS